MRLSTDNAYAELGLAPGASETEVKAAWRRLVSLWHPDRNSSANAVQKMQRLNEALEQISRAGFSAAATKARAEPKPKASPSKPPPPEPPPPEPRPAARTIHRKVELSLEEAALGCTRSVTGQYGVQCATCSGLGWQVLGGRCKPCGGSGAVRRASLWLVRQPGRMPGLQRRRHRAPDPAPTATPAASARRSASRSSCGSRRGCVMATCCRPRRSSAASAGDRTACHGAAP
jgi:hypothetical protein